VLLTESQLGNPLQSKKYAAFKQYSYYIRPGATRLDAGFTEAGGSPAAGGSSEYDSLHSLDVSAFYHEADGRLTFVLLNMLSSSQQMTLHIPDGLDVPMMELFRTSATESFADLGEYQFIDGALLYTVPGMSVSTFTGLVALTPGDFNGDGKVDGADFLDWQAGFGTLYDGQDFLNWQANFGTGSTSVPEPCTLALLGLGALAAVRRRR
jgi:hypothetical protein